MKIGFAVPARPHSWETSREERRHGVAAPENGENLLCGRTWRSALAPLTTSPPLTTGGTRPTAGARGSGLPGLARPAWCSTWAAHTWTLRPIFIGRYLAISILVEFLQRFTGLGDFVGVNGSVLVQVERFEKRVHHALAAHAAGTETGSTWPSRTTGTTGSAWATWAAFARGRTLIAILGHEEAR